MTETDGVLITPEEEQKIIDNAPNNRLPLNPTASGWSGSAVRAALSRSIVGDDSLLELLKSKFPTIKAILDEMKAQIDILFEINKTGLVVFENEAEQNATPVPIGTVAITKVGGQ